MSAVLAASGISVTFGGLKACNEVDLEVHDGQLVGLIGPNGAGKTTTFNAITGFVRKDAGKIEFEGERLEDLRTHQIAEKGVVRTFQITSLFPNLTVLENIQTGRHMKEKTALLSSLLNTRR